MIEKAYSSLQHYIGFTNPRFQSSCLKSPNWNPDKYVLYVCPFCQCVITSVNTGKKPRQRSQTLTCHSALMQLDGCGETTPWTKTQPTAMEENCNTLKAHTLLYDTCTQVWPSVPHPWDLFIPAGSLNLTRLHLHVGSCKRSRHLQDGMTWWRTMKSFAAYLYYLILRLHLHCMRERHKPVFHESVFIFIFGMLGRFLTM